MYKYIKFMVALLLIFIILFNMVFQVHAEPITLTVAAVAAGATLLVAAGVTFVSDEGARQAARDMSNALGDNFKQTLNGCQAIVTVAGLSAIKVTDDIWNAVKGYVKNTFNIGTNNMNGKLSQCQNGLQYFAYGTAFSYSLALPIITINGHSFTMIDDTSLGGHSPRVYRDGVADDHSLNGFAGSTGAFTWKWFPVALGSSAGSSIAIYYITSNGYCHLASDCSFSEISASGTNTGESLSYTATADSTITNLDRDYGVAGDRAVVVPNNFANVGTQDVLGSWAQQNAIDDGTIGDQTNTSILQGIKDFCTGALTGALGGIKTAFDATGKVISDSWASTLGFLQGIKDGILDVGKSIADIWTTWWDWVRVAWGELVKFLEGIKAGILDLVGTLAIDFVSPFEGFRSSIDGKYMPIYNNFKRTVDSMQYQNYVFDDIYANLFGESRLVVKLSIINDYLPTVRVWSASIFWLFYAFFVFDQLYFLIRGSHALNYSIASSNIRAESSKRGK